MNIFIQKLKEVLMAVIPIAAIVLILNFTLVPLAVPIVIRFLIGTVLVVFGLVIFLIGVDIAITPLGGLLGTSITRTNKLWIVAFFGLILGFFISIAEPGLLVLANQVSDVTLGEISSTSLLIVVSIGLAVMVAFGFIRVVYNIPLYKILTVSYIIVFIIAAFTSPEFLAISFDASGATTGVLAVPFILALSLGISAIKKDSKASEKDSFGLVSIASIGAIISVMLLNIFSRTSEYNDSLKFSLNESSSILGPFIQIIPGIFVESLISVSPLIAIFLIGQKLSFKLEKRAFSKMMKGFLYTLIGLIIFFIGVNAGFMDVGSAVGYKLASLEQKSYVIIVGFILGFVTIMAEPAVYVLTHQIEEVTSGYVKRKAVLITLAIGVGIAVALSIIRILVPWIQLWHYLLPGYILAIAMTYFVPKLFVGIAFDAGGVATGPMTATFILAFTQGAAESIEWASVLRDGFGMISMVALIPIITLQTLGLIYKKKSQKEGV